MTLSIILVTYNSEQVITECLESIRTSSGLEDYEIIVVDNASRDNTVRAVEKWSKTSDIKLHIIQNSINVGLSRATNQAFSKAKGDFILLSNPDIIFNDGLRRMLKYLVWEYPDCILGPDLINYDGSLQRMIHRKKLTLKRLFFTFTRTGELIDAFFFRKKMLKDATYRNIRFNHDQADIIDQLGAVMMLTRKSIERLGKLYEERLTIYFGDVDLSVRAKEIGIDSRLFSDVKFKHELGHSYKKSDAAFQRFTFMKDMRTFSEIHHLHPISLKMIVIADAIIINFLVPIWLRRLSKSGIKWNMKVSLSQIRGILTPPRELSWNQIEGNYL